MDAQGPNATTRHFRLFPQSFRVFNGAMSTLVYRCMAWLFLVAIGTSGAGAGAKKTSSKERVGLAMPNGIATRPDGSLLVSDLHHHQVFSKSPEGRISIVAGQGLPGFSGDGSPATRARLNGPMDLLVTSDGALLIADTWNHRIRRVDVHGIITTIAGNGREGYSGDGGPATQASLNNPQSLAIDADGRIYLADTFNHVIRRIDQQGIISTVAGSTAGLAGDGGPATQAQLSIPMAVTIGPDGLLYLSDAGNSRVRRVLPTGIIETIAGHGIGSGLGGAGFEGDGGPALKAKLFSPADLEFDSERRLVISDSGNNRVRRIEGTTIQSLPDAGHPASPGSKDSFLSPQKISRRGETFYIVDRGQRRVWAMDATGQARLAW